MPSASGEITVLKSLFISIGYSAVKRAHFGAHVKQGDHVQAGDLLITADLEQIRAIWIRCDHAGPHLQYTGFSGYGLSSPVCR